MFLCFCCVLTSHLINSCDDLSKCVQQGDVFEWASLLQTVFLSLCFPTILGRPPADQISKLQPRHLSWKTLKQWSVCIFVLAVMSLTMKCESCCGSILSQDGCRSRHCWPPSRAQHPHSQGRPHLKHQETVSEQQEMVSNQKCSNEHFMWFSKTTQRNVH